MTEYIVAKVFLENADGSILVLRRSETAPRRALDWDLPGGWVESHEDPLTAAIRELEEEAGVRLHSLSETLKTVDERDDEIIIRHYFIGITEHPEITLSYEHDRFKWVSKDDFAKTMLYEPHVKAFSKVYKR